MLDTEQSIKDILTNSKIKSAIKSQTSYLKLAIQRYKQLNGISRLEQDAIKIEKSLSEEHRQLAVFDRDRWSGLYDLNLGFGEAKKVARSFYGDDYDSLSDATIDSTELDDLTLCCTTNFKQAECSLQKQIASSQYQSSKDKGKAYPLKPLLILQHKEAEQHCPINNAHRIDYIGHTHHFDFFAELLSNAYWHSYFDMELCQGKHLLHFRATRKRGSNKIQSETFDLFVNEILSVVLISGRPLRHYNATFYLPLDLETVEPDSLSNLIHCTSLSSTKLSNILIDSFKNNDGKTTDYRDYSAEEINAQTQHYYSPLLQKQLFDIKDTAEETDSDIKPIKEYKLNPRNFTTVRIDGANPTLDITNISLFKHPMGQGLLAIQLQIPKENRDHFWDDYEEGDKPCWWHKLFTESKQAKDCQVENYLRFTHAFRVLYPSFLEQEEEDKLNEFSFKSPKGSEESELKTKGFNQFIIKVLTEIGIVTKSEEIKENLRDDRMFVNAAYALAGSTPNSNFAKAENHRLFHLALNIDRQQDTSANGYVYDTDYVHQEQDKYIYKRWQHYGSLYGFTDHSHVYIGYGRFMRQIFVPVHAPYLYARMTILNLLYREQLRHFEHLLCSCHRSDNGSIATLYEKIAKFTNQYWFYEVTEQQQGKEIYRMQSSALGLDTLYETINKEIKTTQQKQKEKNQNYLTSIGLLLAFLGAVYALLPIKELIENSLRPVVNLVADTTQYEDYYHILVLFIVIVLSTFTSNRISKNNSANLDSPIKPYWLFFMTYLLILIIVVGISFSLNPEWLLLIFTLLSILLIIFFKEHFWAFPSKKRKLK